MQQHGMNHMTNLITFFSGCLAMGVATLGQSVGFLFALPLWLPFVVGILGGVASVVAICKSIHEWYLGIQRARWDEEAHRVRMEILTGKKEISDGDQISNR